MSLPVLLGCGCIGFSPICRRLSSQLLGAFLSDDARRLLFGDGSADGEPGLLSVTESERWPPRQTARKQQNAESGVFSMRWPAPAGARRSTFLAALALAMLQTRVKGHGHGLDNEPADHAARRRGHRRRLGPTSRLCEIPERRQQAMARFPPRRLRRVLDGAQQGL